jgi:hypothetical protein
MVLLQVKIMMRDEAMVGDMEQGPRTEDPTVRVNHQM